MADQIISIKEARKLLPKAQSDKMTDEEIAKLVDDLDFLARLALDSYRKGKEQKRDSESFKIND